MKWLATVLMILVVQTSFAQRRFMNFSEIDWRVAAIDAPTPDSLARKLTAPYPSELEKVRAIFRWISEHIAYGVKPVAAGRSANYSRYKPEPMDTAIAALSLDEIVAHSVLKKRVAVCNGYARLFKTLCTSAGIRAEIVTGYARTNMPAQGSRFRSNHTWNAVYIDSTWHLLDVTWASGYSSYTDEFIKHYDDYYFLTPPEHFIRTHYPDDLQWSLLQNPPTLREFNSAPFKLSTFVKYKINSYKPTNGIVEATIGDTLQFELETIDAERDKKIAASDRFDTTALAAAPLSWAFLKPDTLVRGKKISYTYTVASANVEWLHILYNDDVIMRYKLSVQPKKEEDLEQR